MRTASRGALPVLVAPVVDFGYYPAFLRYPGSQHLKAETFIALLDDVLDRLLATGRRAHRHHQYRRLDRRRRCRSPCATSSPGTASQIAVADIRALGKTSARLMQQKLGGHGDEHETSLMLAIAPQSVDMSKAVTDYGNMLERARHRVLPAVGDLHRRPRRAGPTTARPACAAIRPSRPPRRASDPDDMVEELVAGLTS